MEHAAVLLRGTCNSSAVLKSLGELLGRRKWFAGDVEPSLADIVIWSSVKQRHLSAQAPSNITQWLARCQVLPQFANAERLMVL